LNLSEIYRNPGVGIDRPFDSLANHILIYKCLINQNRKDGIKTKDFKMDIIGCVV